MPSKALILTLVLAQACGQGASDLAKSIDKATATNKDPNAPKTGTSTNTTTTTATASVSTITTTTSTTTNKVVASMEDKDPLVGSWVSPCDDGVTTTLVFDGSKMTSITSIYNDAKACKDMPTTFANAMVYEVVGDNGISIGRGAVRQFDIDDNMLILDNNPTKTYRRK